MEVRTRKMTESNGEELSVGLIGLGSMGRGIGRNLLKHGYALAVADCDPAPVAELVAWGASDPGDLVTLAASADVVITCLPDPATIRSIYLGDGGLVATARPGTVLVDCSTSDPLLTREIGVTAADRGVRMVDSPMLKKPIDAWEGTLRLVVGGDDSDIECVRPVLAAFSEEIIPVGGLGNGHAVKVMNNGVGIGTQALICEAFNVARALGVDATTLYQVMQGSNAASRKLDEMVPRIIEDNHSMVFSIDLCLKDTNLFTELANGVQVPSIIGDAVRNTYLLASLQQYGSRNQSELAVFLQNMTHGSSKEPSE